MFTSYSQGISVIQSAAWRVKGRPKRTSKKALDPRVKVSIVPQIKVDCISFESASRRLKGALWGFAAKQSGGTSVQGLTQLPVCICLTDALQMSFGDR